VEAAIGDDRANLRVAALADKQKLEDLARFRDYGAATKARELFLGGKPVNCYVNSVHSHSHECASHAYSAFPFAAATARRNGRRVPCWTTSPTRRATRPARRRRISKTSRKRCSANF
jgi:hypothetical protein